MPRNLTRNTGAKNTQQAGRMMLSATPEKAMLEMMATIDDLRSVYIEENTALDNVDTRAFMSLQDKKLETARRYQQGIEEIMARRDEMRRVDPTLKAKLERMQQDFSQLAANNMQALKRMQRTTERLNNTIRIAAKEAVNKNQATSYGECGRLQNTENRIVSTGVSETA